MSNIRLTIQRIRFNVAPSTRAGIGQKPGIVIDMDASGIESAVQLEMRSERDARALHDAFGKLIKRVWPR